MLQVRPLEREKNEEFGGGAVVGSGGSEGKASGHSWLSQVST